MLVIAGASVGGGDGKEQRCKLREEAATSKVSRVPQATSIPIRVRATTAKLQRRNATDSLLSRQLMVPVDVQGATSPTKAQRLIFRFQKYPF